MSDERKATSDNMKTPMIVSGVIHAAVILIVIFGLPVFKKDIEIVESIPVDMVADISELTSTNKPPVKAPEPKEKKEEPPPPKKEPPKPTPPKSTPPPQPEPPPPEELKEPPKEKTPEVDELAPPKKEEKKPEKKPEPKPKQEKPKPTPPKEEPKKDTSAEDFDKLLQNLAEDEPPQPETPVENDSKLMTEPTPSPNVSRFSDNLSMSEMDALRQQLAGCWNINPGLMNAQDLAVQIRVAVNPDRTVQSVEVVDKGRYNSDTLYRTMADSALRAVQNPRCSPLRLPEDKYTLWRNMTILFDPKEMF